MKAIVLAGGKGTRMLPYTNILPKPLLPIDGMPILEVLIRQMKRYGISEVILTVGHMAYLLESYFKDGSHYGVNISYSHEDEPLGTAGPLSLIDGLDETFMVMNGDVLTTLEFGNLIKYHRDRGGIATIATYRRQVNIDLGVVHVNDGDEIKNYTEKPSMNFNVSMGIYVFEPTVLAYIPKGEYLDFPDLVLKLINAGERVISYAFEGYWQDLGNQKEYIEASEEFNLLREEILGEGA
ncbi:MAG: nucleotidyltransferase family protein [Anaerolineales bacterium]|nr:MAG: nucleotidyltransferase family protein [Anaerolineales bacterium]